jgi:hypothetical protein
MPTTAALAQIATIHPGITMIDPERSAHTPGSAVREVVRIDANGMIVYGATGTVAPWSTVARGGVVLPIRVLLTVRAVVCVAVVIEYGVAQRATFPATVPILTNDTCRSERFTEEFGGFSRTIPTMVVVVSPADHVAGVWFAARKTLLL